MDKLNTQHALCVAVIAMAKACLDGVVGFNPLVGFELCTLAERAGVVISYGDL
jgi:hypothetical protein